MSCLYMVLSPSKERGGPPRWGRGKCCEREARGGFFLSIGATNGQGGKFNRPRKAGGVQRGKKEKAQWKREGLLHRSMLPRPKGGLGTTKGAGIVKKKKKKNSRPIWGKEMMLFLFTKKPQEMRERTREDGGRKNKSKKGGNSPRWVVSRPSRHKEEGERKHGL